MFYSTTAKNAALDAMWGADHGPTMPATGEFGLLTSDPRFGTVDEATYPGYARVAFTNDATAWNAAVDGVKRSTLQTFPDSTGVGDTATHWAIFVAGALYDFGPLSEPISITAAGAGPAVRVRLRFNDRLA